VYCRTMSNRATSRHVRRTVGARRSPQPGLTSPHRSRPESPTPHRSDRTDHAGHPGASRSRRRRTPGLRVIRSVIVSMPSTGRIRSSRAFTRSRHYAGASCCPPSPLGPPPSSPASPGHMLVAVPDLRLQWRMLSPENRRRPIRPMRPWRQRCAAGRAARDNPAARDTRSQGHPQPGHTSRPSRTSPNTRPVTPSRARPRQSCEGTHSIPLLDHPVPKAAHREFITNNFGQSPLGPNILLIQLGNNPDCREIYPY